jgi:chemotaxis protein MotB
MSGGRVIIIKRPVQAAGHHGGGWKIAFADFMTAMMAFFLVMWLLSTASPEQRSGVADHFKMPLKVALSGGPSASMSNNVIPGGGSDPTIPTGEGEAKAMRGSGDDGDAGRLGTLKSTLEAMIEDSPLLRQYRPQLLIDITPEGLRIQIIDTNNRPMFDRSSAVVVPIMREILREISPVLNAQPNKITLSGHTDATRYPVNGAYSNWELSADRANASRRELEAGGLSEGRVLRVVGVAASMHLNSADPYAAMNRRISIVVLNHNAQANIEAANAASSTLAKPPPGLQAAGQAKPTGVHAAALAVAPSNATTPEEKP